MSKDNDANPPVDLNQDGMAQAPPPSYTTNTTPNNHLSYQPPPGSPSTAGVYQAQPFSGQQTYPPPEGPYRPPTSGTGYPPPEGPYRPPTSGTGYPPPEGPYRPPTSGTGYPPPAGAPGIHPIFHVFFSSKSLFFVRIAFVNVSVFAWI
jgi:hypothetical protein